LERLHWLVRLHGRTSGTAGNGMVGALAWLEPLERLELAFLRQVWRCKWLMFLKMWQNGRSRHDSDGSDNSDCEKRLDV